MDLSIIIVTHNSASVIVRCLQSIQKNPPSCSYEVVVVDNASRDGTVEKVKKSFPDVSVISNESNLGYSRGVNQGISFSNGKWILILNPDIEVNPGSIDSLIEFMERTPDTGIAASKLVYPDGTLQHSCRRFYTLSALILRRTFLGKIFPNARPLREHLMLDYDHEKPRKVDWVIGACMMVRREALNNVGKMDERFFLYFEDLDWCYRMAKHGWAVYYVPQSVMVHRYERSSARAIINRPLIIHLLSMLRYAEKWNGLFYLLRKNRTLIKTLTLIIADLMAVNLSFFAAYFLRDLLQPLFVYRLYPISWYLFFIIFYNIIFIFTFSVNGLYQVHRETPASREFFSVAKAVTLGLVILMAASYTSKVRIYSRAVIFGQGAISVAVVFLLRQLIRFLHRALVSASFDLRRVLLVGDRDKVDKFLLEKSYGKDIGIEAVGFIGDGENSLGSIDSLPQFVEKFKVQGIVIIDPEYVKDTLKQFVPYLKSRSIHVSIVSPLAELLGTDGRVEESFGSYIFSLEQSFTQKVEIVLKRLLDFIFALILLPVSIVVFLLMKIAFLIMRKRTVEDERIGFKGTAVKITMVRGDDSREAMCLFDWRTFVYIISGRLSFVGPPPAYESWYNRFRYLYQAVRPGITGRWRRVEQGSPEEALEREQRGLLEWSLGNDLLILISTLPILITSRCPDWFYKKETDSAEG